MKNIIKKFQLITFIIKNVLTSDTNYITLLNYIIMYFNLHNDNDVKRIF